MGLLELSMQKTVDRYSSKMRLSFGATIRIALLTCLILLGVSAPAFCGSKFRIVQPLYGFINTSGSMVIPPRFDAAGRFHEGVAPVRIGQKWGAINSKGETVVKPIYSNIWEFSEGIAAVKSGSRYGAVDHLGVMIIQPRFSEGFSFKEGLAVMKKGSRYGFIDRTGEFFIKPKFSFASNFSEGLACVCENGLFGFIDHNADFAIKPQFIFADSFHDGLAMAETSDRPGKYGFIDSSGKLVIEPQFDECGDFSDGVARVRSGDRWGFVDKIGKTVTGFIYKNAFDSHNGVAMVVTESGEEQLLDATGKVLASRTGSSWSIPSDEEPVFADGLAVVTLPDGRGYINVSGEPAFSGRFQSAADFSGGLAAVQPQQVRSSTP